MCMRNSLVPILGLSLKKKSVPTVPAPWISFNAPLVMAKMICLSEATHGPLIAVWSNSRPSEDCYHSCVLFVMFITNSPTFSWYPF